MRKFASLSLISLILMAPMVANADTNSDIAAYNTAFDKGDTTQALKLLKTALENAKSLPPDNAKLAMIAYENAYYFAVFEDYDSAYSAIKIVDNAFKLKPELQNGSDLDEYAFLSAFINFNVDKKSDKLEKKAQALDLNIEKIKTKERQDDLLFNASNALGKYYFREAQWTNLAINAQRQIDALDKLNKIAAEQLKHYKVIAYVNRGQAKFVHELGKEMYVKLPSLLVGNKFSGWEDALADIAEAEKIYGKPTSINDTIAAALDGWQGMMVSYAKSHNRNELVSERIKNINTTIGLNEKDYFSIYNKDGCKEWAKPNFAKRIPYDRFVLMQYSFGYVRALYDVDSKNKVTNIRVLSSYPVVDFGKSVVDGIEGVEIKEVNPNAPSECRTDNVLKVQFVTD